MYCPNCGHECNEVHDKRYFEWFFISLFFPYIGFIAYFLFKEYNKRAAKQALNGVIGFVGFIVVGILIIILYAVLMGILNA
jgi:hypothetical protein